MFTERQKVYKTLQLLVKGDMAEETITQVEDLVD